ncbi:MAG: hypothetical protein ABFS03_12955, partial [Chloroflexota bacterium]
LCEIVVYIIAGVIIGYLSMIKSLQAKFILLLILPVSLILISAGTVGFLYARNKLLVQWNEAAILKLEKVAHQVDMRLSRPLELLEILYNANDSKDSDISKNSILNRIAYFQHPLFPKSSNFIFCNISGLIGHNILK